jgi:hypothetical protein
VWNIVYRVNRNLTKSLLSRPLTPSSRNKWQYKVERFILITSSIKFPWSSRQLSTSSYGTQRNLTMFANNSGIRWHLEKIKYEVLIHFKYTILYGCETWFLALRAEYGWRVWENRLLRRISEPKWKGATTRWRDNMMKRSVKSSSSLNKHSITTIKWNKFQMCGVEEMKNVQKFFLEIVNGRENFGR